MQKAVVSLSPGQAGFFDELSGVLLNLESRTKVVPECVNVSGLLKAVSDGKITVISGSLDPEINCINAQNELPNYYRLIKRNDNPVSSGEIISSGEFISIEHSAKTEKTTSSTFLDEHEFEEEKEQVEEVKIEDVEIKEVKPKTKKTKKKKESIKENLSKED